MRFRIADALWDGTRADREEEWRHALLDLNYEHDGLPPVLTFDRCEDGGARITLERDETSHEIILSFDLLRDSFRDYREVITRLSGSATGAFGMQDWETLDYAKKLVHDDAGRRIRKALNLHLHDGERIDLALARQLFTLVFLVAQDLPAAIVRRHRRHGPPEL